MSNFSFLQKEFFAICDSATKAEGYLNTDARAACWYARMTLEQIVKAEMSLSKIKTTIASLQHQAFTTGFNA